MIYYQAASWSDILFRWRGTAISSCWRKVFWNFLLAAVTYALEILFETNIGFAFDHSYLLGHTLSFLLVFRANSSYGRYWQGRNSIAHFFANTRDLAFLACTLFKGGHGQYQWTRCRGQDGFSLQRKRVFEDVDDEVTSAARADIVRWSLALAVAFRIHMRLCGDAYFCGTMDEHMKMKLNWDRMRLRTLMSREEFIEVDRALTQYVEDLSDERQLWQAEKSQPQVFHQEMSWQVPGRVHEVSLEPSFQQILVVLNFVTQSVRLHAGEPYGYKERFLPEFIRLIVGVLTFHDRVNQAMTTPLPIPYTHLVRTLLVLYLMSVPFFIDYTEGFWANVGMPTVAALALLGIDQIGGELENPFGEDANDLDIQEMIMSLERELMRLLEMSGDAVARDKFAWVPAPRFMQEETGRPFLWYLALRSEIEHLDVPKRGAGGLWVRHSTAPAPGPRQREEKAAKQ